MRASELPLPASLRRRPSPLPAAIAVLALVLVIKSVNVGLGAWPENDPARTSALLTALAPAGAGADGAISVDLPATPAVRPSVAKTMPKLAEALIDELIAPGAGELVLEDEPLRAEPFLEERRELARQQEALQVRQLAVQVAEERLRGLVQELDTLRAEVENRLDTLAAEDEERIAGLVSLYETMKPKKAAVIFDDLDFDVLTPLAKRIDQRKLAPIVAAMNPEVARELTAELAAARYDDELTAALGTSAPSTAN